MALRWKCLDCGALMDTHEFLLHNSDHIVKKVRVEPSKKQEAK